MVSHFRNKTFLYHSMVIHFVVGVSESVLPGEINGSVANNDFVRRQLFGDCWWNEVPPIWLLMLQSFIMTSHKQDFFSMGFWAWVRWTERDLCRLDDAIDSENVGCWKRIKWCTLKTTLAREDKCKCQPCVYIITQCLYWLNSFLHFCFQSIPPFPNRTRHQPTLLSK